VNEKEQAIKELIGAMVIRQGGNTTFKESVHPMIYEPTRLRNLYTGSTLKRLACLTILVLSFSLTTQGQTQSDAQPLTPGQTLEREIGGAQSPTFKVDVQKNEFFQVRVEQKGVDVGLTINSADGKQLAEMDSPNGKEGFEIISFIADKAGTYFVSVKRLEETGNSDSGKYAITLTAKRSATATDLRRIETERAFVEGMKALSIKGQEEIALTKLLIALRGWKELSEQDLATMTTAGLEAKGEAIATEALALLSSASSEETMMPAFPKFETAADWFQKIESKSMAASAVMFILSIKSFFLGEHSKALQYANQSLSILKANGPKTDALAMLSYVGFLYSFLGDNQNAIRAFDEALALYKLLDQSERPKSQMSEKLILNGLGKAYSELGDGKKALEYFKQALALYTAANDKSGIARTLNEISRVHAALGDKPAASRIGSLALELVKELGDKDSEASLLNDFGEIYAGSGEQSQALNYFNQALFLCKAASPQKKVSSVLDILDIRNLIGATDRNSNCEGLTHSKLMYFWQRYGNTRFAIFHGKQAVNKYQALRKRTEAITGDFKKLYRKAIEGTYRKLADLLIAEGRISEAEQVLGMLKEEEVYTYLRRDDKVAKELLQTVSLTDREREALGRYNELADQITALGKEFGELDVERKNSAEGQFAKQARYDELKTSLADATTTFQKYLDELKIKFGQKDERVVQVDSSLQNTLQRINATRTAVVSTIVGENRLNLIVTTASTQRAHTIDISEKEINQLVADFRQTLTDPERDPRPAGQKLYDVLVKPIEADLKGIEADTILWSLDGTLRYIPTAALWDKQKGYLAERFASIVLTLASRETLALTVSDRRNWNALGVGVSQATEGFTALPAVPDELDCIITDAQTRTVSLKPVCQNGVIAGKKLLDEKFTLVAFENSLGRYPVIHIASHFSLNPGNDKDSFLLLGGGDQRRFTVENLRRVSLTDVELIVLSACNTATPGGEKTNGVEIEGFGAVAQKRGAKAVLATLWSVADDSTRNLMVKFYEHYEKGGVSKAQAIRRAQLALMYGNYKPVDGNTKRSTEDLDAGVANNTRPDFKEDANAPYAHPYYWSPFVLFGNWQ
jgi:CHAT domain-containing protein/tetratricopeptide (TPR) repeat protein